MCPKWNSPGLHHLVSCVRTQNRSVRNHSPYIKRVSLNRIGAYAPTDSKGLAVPYKTSVFVGLDQYVCVVGTVGYVRQTGLS